MSQTLRVVLPAYLESETIREAINRLLNEFDRVQVDAEIVVVLDGPDEITRLALEKVRDERISVRELPSNQGKGAALRAGCVGCESQFVAFLDADLDIHPHSLTNCFEALLHCTDPYVVCAYGSKFHRESLVEYPVTRRIGSYVFRFLIHRLFKIDCADTQTGIKVFHSAPLLEALAHTREQRFLFDVELLAVLARCGGKLLEAPVELNYQYSSTIRPSVVARMVSDLARLRARLGSTNTSEIR